MLLRGLIKSYMVAEIILSRYGFAKVRKLARMGDPDYQVAELGNARNRIGIPSCEEEGGLFAPWINPGWAW